MRHSPLRAPRIGVGGGRGLVVSLLRSGGKVCPDVAAVQPVVVGAGVRSVEIVEVGPRDGLQNEARLVSTADKVALIRRVIAAGVRRVEVASFVNPKRVPQMADAEEVVALLGPVPGVVRMGLVMNARGAERALACGIDQLGAVAVASDVFAIRNQGQSSDESVVAAEQILAMAREAGRSGQVTIAAAYGCPFSGPVAQARVVAMAARLAESRPAEIVLADTIGVAVPAGVTALVTAVKAVAGDVPIRAHFHDTRNTAIANVWAAVEAGVATVDAAIGGLGGCPFAPGAAGNVATEDVLYLLARSGVATGVDLDATIDTARWLGGVMGKAMPSLLSRAGNWPEGSIGQ
ncbi:MAG: hydroxymethylglutaryl-CoA lyase [Sphingomonadales bacterium]|nr:hydroxymethylglutaryl-CoA lyase [Sphingomonadales bacterium]